mmetsp:Transcript_68783/g.161737  ORF Transcript_68783/g.161737 Transcript_68783/m.161737 type:complete len:584 (-) Transcript_68783:2931-4682(-)
MAREQRQHQLAPLDRAVGDIDRRERAEAAVLERLDRAGQIGHGFHGHHHAALGPHQHDVVPAQRSLPVDRWPQAAEGLEQFRIERALGIDADHRAIETHAEPAMGPEDLALVGLMGVNRQRDVGLGHGCHRVAERRPMDLNLRPVRVDRVLLQAAWPWQSPEGATLRLGALARHQLAAQLYHPRDILGTGLQGRDDVHRRPAHLAGGRPEGAEAGQQLVGEGVVAKAEDGQVLRQAQARALRGQDGAAGEVVVGEDQRLGPLPRAGHERLQRLGAGLHRVGGRRVVAPGPVARGLHHFGIAGIALLGAEVAGGAVVHKADLAVATAEQVEGRVAAHLAVREAHLVGRAPGVEVPGLDDGLRGTGNQPLGGRGVEAAGQHQGRRVPAQEGAHGALLGLHREIARRQQQLQPVLGQAVGQGLQRRRKDRPRDVGHHHGHDAAARRGQAAGRQVGHVVELLHRGADALAGLGRDALGLAEPARHGDGGHAAQRGHVGQRRPLGAAAGQARAVHRQKPSKQTRFCRLCRGLQGVTMRAMLALASRRATLDLGASNEAKQASPAPAAGTCLDPHAGRAGCTRYRLGPG